MKTRKVRKMRKMKREKKQQQKNNKKNKIRNHNLRLGVQFLPTLAAVAISVDEQK